MTQSRTRNVSGSASRPDEKDDQRRSTAIEGHSRSPGTNDKRVGVDDSGKGELYSFDCASLGTFPLITANISVGTFEPHFTHIVVR